ncbi:uncharacterized protein LOC123530332 [Mercenaria mercenaria]|uniref:uncharacterized protein LOC123530332 n=1 Tax=Mercenaria mercenaria TaxID=6596 RepID=UPI00234E4177|nr:uncharacterized protein LOC123530332 [Mercenaria mercenaria]
MKKYIRIAALIYVIFLALFWILASGGIRVKGLFIEDFVYQTDAKPLLSGNISKRTTSYTTSTLKRVLPWQWEEPIENTYILDIMKGESFCGGNFTGYVGKFAQLNYVIIDPDRGQGRQGGENISEVLNQPEENEHYILQSGYFKLNCKKKIYYNFNAKSHLRQWLNVLITTAENPAYKVTYDSWTIAVKRYEYVNLYHTMTDFYNAFLVSKAFEMQPGNITILWIDGHPSGTLDITWKTLFGPILRAGYIQQPSMFNHMVWGIMGYDSPLNKHNSKNMPYLEEFRKFFLSRHNIPTKSELNCTKLKVMFLWRRDYVTHPRNPSGSVSRKIQNENELLNSARKHFVGHDIFGIQIDKLDMKNQLKLIAHVDILIGMHGAGLSHTLFLPKHAGLIELYPTYWSNTNIHFKAMARWRNLYYLTWTNNDRSKELPNKYIIVDVKAVTDLIGKMKRNVCR